MNWNDKLHKFFKNNGISQKDAGEAMQINKSNMSKILSGNMGISQEFLIKLLKVYPDIDLNYIFSENYKSSDNLKVLNEPGNSSIIGDIKEIETKLELIKVKLAQDCHEKK